MGSGLAAFGALRQVAIEHPVKVGTGRGWVGGWLRRQPKPALVPSLTTWLPLCSLSLNFSLGPHFWELSLLGFLLRASVPSRD